MFIKWPSWKLHCKCLHRFVPICFQKHSGPQNKCQHVLFLGWLAAQDVPRQQTCPTGFSFSVLFCYPPTTHSDAERWNAHAVGVRAEPDAVGPAARHAGLHPTWLQPAHLLQKGCSQDRDLLEAAQVSPERQTELCGLLNSVTCKENLPEDLWNVWHLNPFCEATTEAEDFFSRVLLFFIIIIFVNSVFVFLFSFKQNVKNIEVISLPCQVARLLWHTHEVVYHFKKIRLLAVLHFFNPCYGRDRGYSLRKICMLLFHRICIFCHWFPYPLFLTSLHSFLVSCCAAAFPSDLVNMHRSSSLSLAGFTSTLVK